MHMLDTDTCSYVLGRRDHELRRRFKVTRDLCISAVTFAELCFGIEYGAPARRRERWGQLDLFTRMLLIEPLDAEVGHVYGRVRAGLARQGLPIGSNDLFIAAHALRLGAVLVTNNETEFRRIPDLTVENWLAS